MIIDDFLASVEQRAYRMAQIALADHDEALDVVQDSMIRLVRRYRLQPADEWPRLFFTILRNRITDSHRRQTLRRRLFGWFERNNEPDGLDDPVERIRAAAYEQPQQQLRYAEAMSALEQALHVLPLRQQQAFILRLVEGLDTRTTAQVMGCSEGSVKTHLSRALSVLKENLEDHYVPGE